MRLWIFEDEGWENFSPLTLTRPVFRLKIGFWEMWQRSSRMIGISPDAAFTRSYLQSLTAAKTGLTANPEKPPNEDLLLLNGRAVRAEASWAEEKDVVGIQEGQVVFASLSQKTVEDIWSLEVGELISRARDECSQVEVQDALASYPWDLFLRNGEAIRGDFQTVGKSGIDGTLSQGSFIVGEKTDIYIAPGARVDPTVVLDATEGPIYIDENVRIYPHTRVEGPSYIGPGTLIVGGKIREGCSIGPVCRIGGEVEESIFHGYSNKYHDGFIGHSYVGEWVNLGALTTNSDLKNDYSTVKIYVNGRLTETGETKVGSLIADHVKTGIGVLLNTGTVVGVGSVLMPSGEVLPKLVPSFVLVYKNRILHGLGLENTIQTAKTVMSRRKVVMTEEEAEMLRKVYQLTSEERETLIRKDRRKRRLG